MRYFLALLAALALTACDQSNDTLKVGGKNFSESEILSEMMAALAEAEGIVVTRRIGIGPTRLNLESLKRGEIDIYAEYNGTGLVMLGQPALADGDEAIEKVRGLYEPLGIVNLEAMACETAVVASDVGGIPEVVADGVTGTLVHYDEDDAATFESDLAAAVNAVVREPDRARAMGAAGRERAVTEFGWDTAAHRTMAIYESLLA